MGQLVRIGADEIVVARIGELSQGKNHQKTYTAEGGGKTRAYKTQQEVGKEGRNSGLDFIVCSVDVHEANAKEAVDSEDYVHFVGQAMHADISAVVRQTIILEVDLKPLCSEDCKGLCTQCGKDLNKGVCDCQDEEIDERWAALKDVTPPEQQPDNS